MAKRKTKKSPAETPRQPGRPTKLTPEVRDEIVNAIGVGSYLEEAAEAAGVSRSVAFAWIDQGRKEAAEGKTAETSPHVEFLDAVTRARARDAVRDLAFITKASQSEAGALDWKAAAWKRERKNPKRWGPKVRVSLEDNLNEFLSLLEAKLPREWFDRICEIAAAHLGGGEAPGATRVEEDDATTAVH